jgi:hypothetical protein
VRFPTPLPPDAALDLVSTSEGVRRWWAPDARVEAGVLTPAWGPLVVRRDSLGVTWSGEGVAVRFVVGDGLTVEGRPEVDEAARAWDFLLPWLGDALAEPTPISWQRVGCDVALSYGDAWTRLGRLGRSQPGDTVPGTMGELLVRQVLAPQGLAWTSAGASFRLWIGPGANVNHATLDMRGPADGEAWRRWLEGRMAMSWLAQTQPVGG